MINGEPDRGLYHKYMELIKLKDKSDIKLMGLIIINIPLTKQNFPWIEYLYVW